MRTAARTAAHPLDRTRHVTPQVFERLRDLIVSMELEPGTILSRVELASRFGVSQTPVREALLKLIEEGLVDVFPQHATVVSRIDLTAARQAHFLRRAIEIEVVRVLASRPDAALIAELRGAIAEQKARRDEHDYREFTATDQRFHRLMYESAGVPDLWPLVRRLSGHLDRLRRLHLPVKGKALSIVRDHAAIVDAIEAGKPDAAADALREHLSGTLKQAERIRERNPEFVLPE